MIIGNKDESSSWVDMLKTIEASKRQLPWDPSKVEPVVRTNLAARKLAERDLDILAMEYRDPAREDQVRARTAKLYETVRARADDIKKSKFNILNHEGPPRKLDLVPRVEKDTSTRDWHILSHLPKQYHKKFPAAYDEELSRTLLQRPHPAAAMVRSNGRDFDLINNNYKTNHDEKLREEYERTKEYTLKKYWANHDLNIISGEYYDVKKENEFIDQRTLGQSLQGLDQMRKLPPSTKYSEGNTYNIVNHEISNQERFLAASSVRDRGKNRSKGATIDARVRKECEDKFDRDEERKLNRVSYKRWEKIIDRGFHIVNNTRFADEGAGGEAGSQAGNTTEFNRSYQPHPSRPATVWDRFKVDAPRENVSRADDFAGEVPSFFKSTTGPAEEGKDAYPRHSHKPTTAAVVNNSHNGDIRASTAALGTGREPSQLSHRHGNNNHTKHNLPSINISGTIKHQDVAYKEPTSGHGGQGVPIVPVRTGGFM